MHSFRLRYIALGLLIYIQSAFSRTCVRDFDDVPSNTARSEIVFEGRAHREVDIPESPGLYAMKFRVRQVLKGRLERSESAEASRHTVVVGWFGSLPGNDDVDDDNCVVPRIVIGASYLVFVQSNSHNTSSNSRGLTDLNSSVVDEAWPRLDVSKDSVSRATLKLENHFSSPVLRILTSPVTVSERALKEVREYACQKCVRAPHITKLAKSKEVISGKRIRIQCRTSGKPKPLVTWFKDGAQLQYDNRKKSKEVKRGSRLELRRVRAEDSGTYQCRAVNALGQTAFHNTTLIVTSDSQNDYLHSTLCSTQTFCLNGGTCYLMTSLNQKLCRCTNNYIGLRCEELNTGHNSLMTLEKDGTYGKRKRYANLRHRRHNQLHQNMIVADQNLLELN